MRGRECNSLPIEPRGTTGSECWKLNRELENPAGDRVKIPDFGLDNSASAKERRKTRGVKKEEEEEERFLEWISPGQNPLTVHAIRIE